MFTDRKTFKKTQVDRVEKIYDNNLCKLKHNFDTEYRIYARK